MNNEDIKVLEDIKEIINRCKECKFATCEQCEINWTQIKTIEHLLNLYNKEKEKNKELKEYANWHIEHLTEDIADYIDDDRRANASLIGELKEEREHWKDIIRISNNEKTYIDYKNY